MFLEAKVEFYPLNNPRKVSFIVKIPCDPMGDEKKILDKYRKNLENCLITDGAHPISIESTGAIGFFIK